MPALPMLYMYLPFNVINILNAVVLEAPDTVLIERQMGKRVDPETGGKRLDNPSLTARVKISQNVDILAKV